MPVPTNIDQLNTTAASNSPAGSDSPIDGDNFVRALSSFIALLRDKLNGTSATGTLKTPAFTGIPTGTVTSGAYTPTTTAVANVSNVTLQKASYTRIGDYVDVSIAVSVSPTSAASGGQFHLTLPIASNFSSTSECIGTITGISGIGETGLYGIVTAEISGDRLNCFFYSQTTTPMTATVMATYKVI